VCVELESVVTVTDPEVAPARVELRVAATAAELDAPAVIAPDSELEAMVTVAWPPCPAAVIAPAADAKTAFEPVDAVVTEQFLIVAVEPCPTHRMAELRL
jgi:hypothetical protein